LGIPLLFFRKPSFHDVLQSPILTLERVRSGLSPGLTVKITGMKRAPLLAVLALAVYNATAQSVPVYGRNGMVSTAEPHATAVGVDILKAGGNAFDAAAAIGFALAVTYPQAGNLGGGGFMVALARDGKTYSLDFRETAPALATRDMFLDEKGDVAPDRSTKTHLAVGVPGTVDGLLEMHAKFGKLPRQRVLAPAIGLAKNGFPVSFWLSEPPVLLSRWQRAADGPLAPAA
jgi:gamma-glutamyltranspeptidase / glutathione hydrolase